MTTLFKAGNFEHINHFLMMEWNQWDWSPNTNFMSLTPKQEANEANKKIKDTIALWALMLSRRDYRLLGAGTHRVSFLSPNKKFVVKIPRNWDGLEANAREERLFKRQPFPAARCRMHKFSGILVMEYVDFVPYQELKKHEWTDWIDCRQVGRNRRGDLVAYDYG